MVVTARSMMAAVLLAGTAVAPGDAGAAVLGSDAAACTSGEGPAILANVSGLKDRTGDLRLELYPATEEDFLRADHELIAQGKVFRRVIALPPAAGPVSMCIKVPRPGTFALLFAHNRDGHNKFSFWSDGIGFPGNMRIGRARPKLAGALITVGRGVAVTNIKMQYLRGLGGFGPLDN
jgi:uncharacterized protein (DUF2141 family)